MERILIKMAKIKEIFARDYGENARKKLIYGGVALVMLYGGYGRELLDSFSQVEPMSQLEGFVEGEELKNPEQISNEDEKTR